MNSPLFGTAQQRGEKERLLRRLAPQVRHRALDNTQGWLIALLLQPEEYAVESTWKLAPRVALTGPDGLLKAITMTVVEAALEEELADHHRGDAVVVDEAARQGLCGDLHGRDPLEV
jgi:hypothetical protein